MKTYTVSLCRVEHRVYQIQVKAKTPEKAYDLAVETWDDDDGAFTDMGVAHAEEFIENVEVTP